MGLWRSDPEPVQRINRLPASAFSTGSQPPRTTVAGVITMACIMASTPQQGEPPLHQQNRNPRQIAPQTLVYGQQPHRIDPSPRVQTRVVIGSWPEEREPRLQFKNQQPERRYIVTLTLTYGSQPPVAGSITPTEMSLMRWSWEPPRPEPPPRLPTAAWNFPPAATSNPPIAGQLAMAAIRRAWAEPLMMAVSGAGIIRITGPSDQPPPSGPLAAFADYALLRYLWESPFQSPPASFVAAVAFVPPVVSNPPIGGPLTPTELSLLRNGWEAPFLYPESEANSASWNVPAVAQNYLVPNQAPWWIGASWREPFGDIQFSGWFVPASPNDQPPVIGYLSTVEMTLARWSWEPTRPEPPALVKIAPLSLTYGQQPPNTGPLPQLVYIIAQTPAIWWPSQSEPDNAHWNIQVVSAYAAYTRQQDAIVRAWFLEWGAQSEGDTAAWNFPPPVVNNPPPFARLPLQILLPAIWWPSQSAGPNAGWNILAVLTRAIAQSVATNALDSADSQTILLFSVNNGVASIESSD